MIRHALPVRTEVADGPADPGLSDQGRQQAVLLTQYLASEHVDAVYSSPLRRAVETAEPLAGDRGLDMTVEPDVAEWDRESGEYVPVEELKAADDPRWRALLEGEWDAEESPEEFRARAVGAVERIIAAHRGQRIAVVCHGGVINAYFAHVLAMRSGFTNGFFYPNYTSINRIAAASTGERSVVTINETSHLRGSGLPMGLFQQG